MKHSLYLVNYSSWHHGRVEYLLLLRKSCLFTEIWQKKCSSMKSPPNICSQWPLINVEEREKRKIWASDQDYFGKHGLRRKDGTLHRPQHLLLDIGWNATHACDSPANIFTCVLVSVEQQTVHWIMLWKLVTMTSTVDPHKTFYTFSVLVLRREKYFYR